jgi:hypothetical protein
MKRSIVLVFAAVLVMGPAQPAQARPQRPQVTIDQLQAQVVALRRQVTTLRSQVRKLQSAVKTANSEIQANFVGDTCLAALTADELAATWQLTDQLAQKTVKANLFGPQTLVDDKSACESLQPNPVKRSGTTPTLPLFQTLIDWLSP